MFKIKACALGQAPRCLVVIRYRNWALKMCSGAQLARNSATVDSANVPTEIFFTVCIARTRSKVPPKRINLRAQHVLRTPWSHGNSIKPQRTVYYTACALHTLCQTTKEAPAGENGRARTGTRPKARDRGTGGRQGTRGTPEGQDQGPMATHRTNGPTCNKVKASSHHPIAYLPSSMARSGQLTMYIIWWANVTTTPYRTPIRVPT